MNDIKEPCCGGTEGMPCDTCPRLQERPVTAHPIDRDHLRKLADDATPGPWEAEWDIGEGTLEVLAGSALPGPDGDRSGSYFTTDMILERDDVWEEDDGDQHAANAEFIAAARTAVPALLDALAAAEHRATRAEAQSATRKRQTAYWRAETQRVRDRSRALGSDTSPGQ